MKGTLGLLVLLCCLGAASPAVACTTTLAGREATADGSVLVSSSNDGLSDPRLIYVPAKDHAPGSLRPVYYAHYASGYLPRWGGSENQRLRTAERGPGYDKPGAPRSVPLGFIPQVAHTYAYFDGNYAVLNEHQVSIGESTAKAKVEPEPDPGRRLFYAAELSRVALERCRTAREAVLLMGSLIERYGYHGPGETLLVADPREGWVMEMCGFDADGAAGAWVARRVPDDAFFVAANQFRIREVLPGDPDMLSSANLFEAARAKGWWKPEDGPLDWAAVFGDGEFHHPYYSLRRVWRALSLAAPSLGLPAWVEGPLTRAYPFAVKPDRKLSVQDLVAIHRDNYEGTEFDLSRGLAAGPFGDPTRFEGLPEALADAQGRPAPLQGAFERPLSIYRCVYFYVNQSRSWLPDELGAVTWYGADRPATSVPLPFHPGARTLPGPVQRGDALRFERDSLWTAFNYVANYAMLRYASMIQDIGALQRSYEARTFGAQAGLEAEALKLWRAGRREKARNLLARRAETLTGDLLRDWWKLSEDLYVKYNDGYVNTPGHLAQEVFYPVWWLRAVGYGDGPVSYARPGK